MKKGQILVIALGVSAAVALAFGLWVNTFTYYHEVDPKSEVTVGGAAFKVSDFRGVDNTALPLRLRSCFRLADPAAALAAGKTVTDAEPFDAPYWFDCWDAPKIDADLKARRAKTVIAGERKVGEFTFQRIMAIYPDGRAFQWRRLLEPEK